MLKSIKISAAQMTRQDDWRPSLYLSGGAVLRQLGGKWPCLGDMAEHIIDGWRVSHNPTADSFNSAVMSTPLYHLRNIQPYFIETDPRHWQTPHITGKLYCTQPHDVLIRKVGGASAALMTDIHSQHPIDANLIIVRGLSPYEAVWVCFCLNQPLYQDYLNESDAITILQRLGLKKLKNTPICPMPRQFIHLAQAFLGAYGRLANAQRELTSMRKQVDEWLDGKLSGFDACYWMQSRQCHWQFFSPRHIDDSLLINQVEQNYLRGELIGKYRFHPVSDLSEINPRQRSQLTGAADKVLQISNITDFLTLKQSFTDRADSRWRFQNRRLKKYDVVMSTFAENARVAYLHQEPEGNIYPSGQIVVFNFYRYPAAYALLMESWLIRMQLQRLASGGGFRFIQPQHVKKLVLPDIDPDIGAHWQQKVVEHHERSHHAHTQLTDVLHEMTGLFFNAHKTIRTSGVTG